MICQDCGGARCVCRELDTMRAGTAAQTREWEKAMRAEMDNCDHWKDEYENLITVANSLEAERDAARAWSRRWKALARKRNAEREERCGLEGHAGALSVNPDAVDLSALAEAASELLEVADLRGDSTLPRPCNDPQQWTARMQDAWDELREVLAGPGVREKPEHKET